MRVADYIFKKLNSLGIDTAFCITGGGSMYLNDALSKNKKIKTIFTHHEQACAIAAEGYSRVTGKPCLVCVTTGPAGLNTLTGVLGQWTDSVPVIYISGQVSKNLMTSIHDGFRQLGDQECPITKVVEPLVKYVNIINAAKDCDRILIEGFKNATTSRQGPVWIDVPMDIQKAKIPTNHNPVNNKSSPKLKSLLKDMTRIKSLIKNSKCPLIVVGNGCRPDDCIKDIKRFSIKNRIPIVTTFNGMDQIEDDFPLYIGRIGSVGQRAANIVLQNSDLVLFLGTRNNIRQVGFNWDSFCKNAIKIIVDIDQSELNKPTIIPDIAVRARVYDFIKKLNVVKEDLDQWLAWCKSIKNKYKRIYNEQLDPYVFFKDLTNKLNQGDIVVCGNGTACVCAFQEALVKKYQRYIWNSGCASMGYDIPAAIGASIGEGHLDERNKHFKVICVAGDGSIMMNLQELQTISSLNLPIKIFILNNNGYYSIKQTQKNYFNSDFFGCDPESGISFPSFKKIAKAFNIKYKKIKNIKDLNLINDILILDIPVICEVILPSDYNIEPKLAPRIVDKKIIPSSIDDMFPFLSEKEMRENIYDRTRK